MDWNFFYIEVHSSDIVSKEAAKVVPIISNPKKKYIGT